MNQAAYLQLAKRHQEQRMALVRETLARAAQAPTMREGDALVACAANILAGVVHTNTRLELRALQGQK